MGFNNFLNQLKERNVIKGALAYLGVSWVLLQVLAIILPTFDAPKSIMKVVLVLLIVGFPIWLVFSWTYTYTADGFKKTENTSTPEALSNKTDKKLNKLIIGLLAVAILLLGFNLFRTFEKPPITATIEAVADDEIVKKIAVLPFTDLSPEKDQAYFADGVSEELLNMLNKIQNLGVIAKTSSFSFRDGKASIDSIAKVLDVSHIIDGSIRKADSTFKITVNLIETKTGSQLWTETYDRNISSIFETQEEVAKEVAHQLTLRLGGHFGKVSKADPQAYDLFLRGMKAGQNGNPEDLQNAKLLFEQSIVIDSTFAPTYLAFAEILRSLKGQYGLYPEVSYSDLDSLYKKALDLDTEDVKVNAIYGSFKSFLGDFKSAEFYLNKASDIEPNNLTVMSSKKSLSAAIGKIETEITILKKLKNLNPLIPYDTGFSMAYYSSGDYGLAEKHALKDLEEFPESVYFYPSQLSMIQMQLGKLDEATNTLAKEQDPFWKLYVQCKLSYVKGNIEEANILFEHFKAEYEATDPNNVAQIHAFRGEVDLAFKAIDKQILLYDGKFLGTGELSLPEFKNLWGDPRWNKLILSLNLPDDHGFHLDMPLE